MAGPVSNSPFVATASSDPIKAPALPKFKRPNFNMIHADPLPVTLYSAPPLIPHNPLSLLHHLYLYIFPSTPSHKTRYTGVFSPITMSVEVTDPEAVLDLWRRGFWGKGSLSRSEPTWLQREMRRLGDVNVGETSEEVTRRRRDQRKEMKKERAMKEKEELQKVKQAEAGNNTNNGKPIIADVKVVVNLEEEINGLNDLVDQPLQPSQSAGNSGLPTPPLSIADEAIESKIVIIARQNHLAEHSVSTPQLDSTPTYSNIVQLDPKKQTKENLTSKNVVVKNKEHLQLTPSETFFLAYALGILTVTTSSSRTPLPVSEIFLLFLRYSVFPPLPQSSISLNNLNPDNPFLINYVVYHHFRTLGWVVKSGVKFSVDYLLYKRGPVFSHAEFAVLIIPSYSRWKGREDTDKEWYWLHSITRVNSQVKKTVLLAYVDVPTAEEVNGWEREGDGVKEVLGKYMIREVVLRRWIPGRNRD